MKPVNVFMSVHCTFLKCASVSGFRSHSSVMSTTAPCNTPTDNREYLEVVACFFKAEIIDDIPLLTMVLLSEEGTSRRGKELPQVLDFSHNMNSAQSSLEKQCLVSFTAHKGLENHAE